MPLYLTRFSYTPETWAKLIQNPEDRRAAATEYIEFVGGKLHGFWYAFGDHDGYNLWEAPDNVSMAATALAIGSGGALSSVQTTVLLTVEDTLAALQKAASIKYRLRAARPEAEGLTVVPARGQAGPARRLAPQCRAVVNRLLDSAAAVGRDCPWTSSPGSPASRHPCR